LHAQSLPANRNKMIHSANDFRRAAKMGFSLFHFGTDRAPPRRDVDSILYSPSA